MPTTKIGLVKFEASKKETLTVSAIANRAIALCEKEGIPHKDKIDYEMDLIAVHSNGCTMNFEKLLAADDFNFAHDVFGIARKIKRKTGKLNDCFLPRCTGEYICVTCGSFWEEDGEPCCGLPKKGME